MNRPWYGEDGSLYVSADHGRHFHGFGQSVPMAIFDLIQAADGSIILAGSGGILVLPARGAS